MIRRQSFPGFTRTRPKRSSAANRHLLIGTMIRQKNRGRVRCGTSLDFNRKTNGTSPHYPPVFLFPTQISQQPQRDRYSKDNANAVKSCFIGISTNFSALKRGSLLLFTHE
jgi:hypothetical protein